MKKLTILLSYLLIAVSVYCQTDYPRLILIDGDTVVALEPIQITKMNVAFLELEKCERLYESATEEILLLYEKDSISFEQKKNLQEQIEKLERIDNEKSNQIDILEDKNKKQGKQIKLLKKSRPLFMLGGIIVGSVSTYFVTQLIE